jgi:DNA-binding transcriptional regulator YdaS (Cro superfamily)
MNQDGRTSDGMQKVRRAAGGRDADIARPVGITPSAVSRWNGIVPTKRAIEIETLTSGRVTRYDIRPDHFGPPPIHLNASDRRAA